MLWDNDVFENEASSLLYFSLDVDFLLWHHSLSPTNGSESSERDYAVKESILICVFPCLRVQRLPIRDTHILQGLWRVHIQELCRVSKQMSALNVTNDIFNTISAR